MAKTAQTRSAADAGFLNVEIAQLRDLGLEALLARWRRIFRKEAPGHLARHHLLSIIAYRMQADVLGDLDLETLRFLKQIEQAPSPKAAVPLTQALDRRRRVLTPGTVLAREWSGRPHHVVVTQDGFSWEARPYTSLSEVAYAITGTKWNGPRFFGLRDRKNGGSP